MKLVIVSALALILLLPLAACDQPGQTGSQPSAEAQTIKDAGASTFASGISGEIQKQMMEAKQELPNRNIELNSIHIGDSQHIDVNGIHIGFGQRGGKDSRPKAEITPQGELLIAGTKVAATPTQQGMLLDYRKQIIGIAQAGMDIGAEGADLGINAAKQALRGVLAGNSDKDIEAALKPQTNKIRTAALKLCQRLPDLLSTQQKLAAAMPEFRPYATMQKKDVDNCGKNAADADGKKGFAVFSD